MRPGFKRTDANQREIVSALRAAGCSVQSLAEVGRGVPDLLVGLRGTNYLLEVKDGSKPPSARELTDWEAEFCARWKGRVSIVLSVSDALAAVGLAQAPVLAATTPSGRMPLL